jgi:formylglycine-generating enzyme required for sulfatase activity
MGGNPSRFTACGEDCPVEQVSWCEAVVFANRLSLREGFTPAYAEAEDCSRARLDPLAEGYRLPTDAEWVWASRAGAPTHLAPVEEGSATRPVGQGPPNAWGFHDMRANVWEWVGDARDDDRLRRGGAWSGYVGHADSGDLSWNHPSFSRSDLGLRLARSLPAPR